jgi:hypothetical protein
VKQPATERLHVIEGTDWKTSIIALLESRSPYRPWRYGFGEAHEGGPVAIVLHTEPRTVMTTLATIGKDGRPDRAVMAWVLGALGLVDLDSLVMLLDLADDVRDVWQLRSKAARQLEKALAKAELRRDLHMRFGHSTVAAARVLLHSQRRCTGCDHLINMTGTQATEAFHIRTVDASVREAPEVLIKEGRGVPSYVEEAIPTACWLPTLPKDWPGVLCRSCSIRMELNGHASLIDFRFSQHATCRRCSARKVQAMRFGMPVSRETYQDCPPWIDWRGCCNTGEGWTCAMCAYEW